jgi:hypothetical protein
MERLSVYLLFSIFYPLKSVGGHTGWFSVRGSGFSTRR